MKNTVELDCNVECLLCGKDHNLSMYAHRNKEHIVGWVFICAWCNKILDAQGYQLHWYLENEDGKRLK